MNSEAIADVADALLAASLPIGPDALDAAAERIIRFYENDLATASLPEEEVADRFRELWGLWFASGGIPSKELCVSVCEAISADQAMERLAHEYFQLEEKLENKSFMSRSHAIALIGCSPLIHTLVSEQHLGLDRIRSILNVPGATFGAIRSVLSAIGIIAAFDQDNIQKIHSSDVDDVATFFGDALPDEAETTLKNLLGRFSGSEDLWESVNELVCIGFKPYLFMLYFELLTLEMTDRFPGRAIYECEPRGTKVKALWNSMYHPTQENPYLNNAKSVYSLDDAWAETKLSRETQNGSIMLANIFDIMSELPYATRRRVAHVVRCYLVLAAAESQVTTPLDPITPTGIKNFVKNVSVSNSLTKGVLDQRLVDFLTMCLHESVNWAPFGLGSSVNESNASGKKYGDVEYLNLNNRINIQAYEAHGGGLRDEYILSHINSLAATVRYHKEVAMKHGEDYKREVEIVYVAHDTSRLSQYKNGHIEEINGVPFTFRFITFHDLLDEAGGINAVCQQTDLFTDLIHTRISRLPNVYPLKKKYQSIIAE